MEKGADNLIFDKIKTESSKTHSLKYKIVNQNASEEEKNIKHSRVDLDRLATTFTIPTR